MVRSRSRVKVFRKGHRIFASARRQTLLRMHKKFDGDIIVSFLRYSVAKNDNSVLPPCPTIRVLSYSN